jgi:transposase
MISPDARRSSPLSGGKSTYRSVQICEASSLSKSDAVLIAAIENNVPELTIARSLIADFQEMIRSKAVAKLDGWLERAKASLVGSFANGVEKDIAAVRNAIISPWSNGQTEGQITKLKLIKRQMYGRAKIDLLQARLIGVT